MRLTIGASDFSPIHSSFDDMPRGETDPALAHFSIAPIQGAVFAPGARRTLAQSCVAFDGVAMERTGLDENQR
jgi:glucosylceramidase